MPEAVKRSPDPHVEFPLFLVHQDGDPIVVHAGFVSLVADATEEMRRKCPACQTEIVVQGRAIFVDESLVEVSEKMIDPNRAASTRTAVEEHFAAFSARRRHAMLQEVEILSKAALNSSTGAAKEVTAAALSEAVARYRESFAKPASA